MSTEPYSYPNSKPPLPLSHTASCLYSMGEWELVYSQFGSTLLRNLSMKLRKSYLTLFETCRHSSSSTLSTHDRTPGAVLKGVKGQVRSGIQTGGRCKLKGWNEEVGGFFFFFFWGGGGGGGGLGWVWERSGHW